MTVGALKKILENIDNDMEVYVLDQSADISNDFIEISKVQINTAIEGKWGSIKDINRIEWDYSDSEYSPKTILVIR